LGLGAWFDKKLSEQKAKSTENRERQKKLNAELEGIRWKKHVERKKAEAATQNPSRVVRVFNTLGTIGEASSAASKGLVGNMEIDPSGGMSGFGFDVADPLALPGGNVKRQRHRSKRQGGFGHGQDIHVHVHTERERGRNKRR
jgi:hypothetical protein